MWIRKLVLAAVQMHWKRLHGCRGPASRQGQSQWKGGHSTEGDRKVASCAGL